MKPHDVDAQIAVRVMAEDRGGVRFTRVRPYSRDIAAAWEIVRRLTDGGYQFVLTTIDGVCRVEFKDRETYDVYSGVGETPAEAICRAALRIHQEREK